jgi:ADP-heptose:LPS heptosyltransferase
MRYLKRSNFDLVIDLQGLFRTGFFGWITGSNFRYGPADARELAHFFYTHKIKPDSESIHILDYYLSIAAAAGASVSQPEYVLPDTSDAISVVSEKLEESGVDIGNFAVIVPGSAHADKCWSIEKFAEVADFLAKEKGMKVVAVGAASESWQTELLNEAAETDIVNLAGKTNLRELMCVLDKAELVVTNDTGPGHIAAASGTKVVMIFGRSNPARVRPYYQPDSVAAVESDKRGIKPNSKNPKHSIENVSFELVLDKIRKQLRS